MAREIPNVLNLIESAAKAYFGDTDPDEVTSKIALGDIDGTFKGAPDAEDAAALADVIGGRSQLPKIA